MINDADGEMVTFYRYVQHHPEALRAELARWPGNSRANFATLRDNPGITDLQRAVRWYMLKVSSFCAQGRAWGRDRRNYYGYDPDRHWARIEALGRRLARVMVECGDWERVVEFYDGADTFHFFDPPYIACEKTAYVPFTAEDMARVRARLDKLQGTWLLTCDDSPACREIFDGLPMQPMAIRYRLGNHAERPKESGELLIMHPRLAPENLTTLEFTQKGSARTAATSRTCGR